MRELEKRLDDLFALWQKPDSPGGQILVVHKGKTVLERCFGYADLEKKHPITPDSVFSVASISKQITATSILILHDWGLLHVEDDIRKYIPDLVNFREKVTVTQLLHHCSGMREHCEIRYYGQKPGDGVFEQTQIQELIARQKNLSFKPGTEFVYCNSSFICLATIVERVSGMTLNEFAKKNIFEPLGMKDTCFKQNPDLPEARRVMSYRDNGYTYTPVWEDADTYGCGGLRSTCRDMAKFMPQYTNPTLVSRETMEKIHLQPLPLLDGTVPNYGCALWINDLDGQRYYQHGGVTAGFRLFTGIFPKDDLIVEVFSNTDNTPFEAAGEDIARIVLGLPSRVRKDLNAYRTDGVDLCAVEGGYLHEESGMLYEIAVRNGQPWVRFCDNWTPLTHVEGNLYRMGRRNITFAFGGNAAVNHEDVIKPLRKLADKLPEGAADYTGSYYCSEVDGTFFVVLRDGNLYLEHAVRPSLRLFPLDGEQFCCNSMGSKRLVRFIRENGTVIALAHDTLQSRGLIFEKNG